MLCKLSLCYMNYCRSILNNFIYVLFICEIMSVLIYFLYIWIHFIQLENFLSRPCTVKILQFTFLKAFNSPFCKKIGFHSIILGVNIRHLGFFVFQICFPRNAKLTYLVPLNSNIKFCLWLLRAKTHILCRAMYVQCKD